MYSLIKANINKKLSFVTLINKVFMKSYILLENIVLFANHGVFEQETKVGNVFVVNLKMEIDLEKASFSDELGDTISYADVYDAVKDEMKTPSKLLEHAAGRIIRRLKSMCSDITMIELKLSKRNPPVGGQVDFASVVIID